jgi:hypothetical protein
MIIVQSDEHEATAKREICARCRRSVVPHEDTDHGPLCRPCTLDATEIRLEYVIDGRIYSKRLKGTIRPVTALKTRKPRIPAVPAVPVVPVVHA